MPATMKIPASLITALFAALLLAAPVFAPETSAAAQTTPAVSSVVELKIDGEIEPVLAEYIVQGIETAKTTHASLILITMNTPGGLDSSMRQIIQAILQSPVPVVTYVSPTGSRAASAGFFILLAADVAAMSPGTDTGAASPLLIFGGTPVDIDATLRSKIVNEATAYLRSYASKRGHNTELAEKAITEAKAFSEKEALDGKLIDMVAGSREALLGQLSGHAITRFDGSTVTLDLSHPVVVELEMSAREKFLARIVQPDVFFILLIVGVLGLYAEFTHPGMFAPGVIGGISLILALYAMHLLPVNLAGLALILLALALFVLEAKFPTHGILGVGGVVAMVLGALMLVRSPLTGMGVSLGAALGVALPCALIVIFLMRLVMRSMRWRQSTGTEEMVGKVGEVTQAVESGRGMVRIEGELWQAAAAQQIPRGTRVRVKKVDGLTLHVEPADASARAAS
jgi:membrane-bound serine protease (ClpP class)